MDNTTSMDHVEFTDRRSLPMMALRGLTVFPGMMLTFEVERSMSIAALNMAMSDDQIIYLVPQIDIATDIPTPEDVYGVGTVCRIKQMMKNDAESMSSLEMRVYSLVDLVVRARPDAGRAHRYALLRGGGRAACGCRRAQDCACRGAHPSLLQPV